jgi:hypothetical protein
MFELARNLVISTEPVGASLLAIAVYQLVRFELLCPTANPARIAASAA